MVEPDEDNDHFSGEIVVASQIVDALSSGLYESPAACLKELINNAYDADAALVRVYVKPDADAIVIHDDGHGMTKDDFEKNFKRISESHKRDSGGSTAKYDRPKVGKIGIGFIAANELCQVMEIESSVAGRAELLRVFINFAEMRIPAAERRVEGTDDIRKGDYEGDVEPFDDVDANFTRITLHDVTDEAREVWASTERQTLGDRLDTVYGKKTKSITEMLQSEIKSWDDLDLYSKTYLDVALNVPVRYLENWIDPEHHDTVKTFEERVDRLDFNVRYDGLDMRKPIVLASEHPSLCQHVKYEGEHVSFEGYLYARGTIIKPQEVQGVLVRIRNAAVGGYDRDFLGYPSGENQVLRNWVSAELYAGDELEAAMNIDRRTFRVTHRAYVELQEQFHRLLHEFLRTVRRDIYGARREERAAERIEGERTRVTSALAKRAETIPAPTRKRLTKPWDDAENDVKARRQLLRSFSVSELLEITLATAADHLDEDELAAFVEDLFARLRQK